MRKTVASPLVVFPDETVALPLRYFGNIAYYAAMAAYGRAVICDDALYDKREKSVHRCDIADTHGLVSLTVPVSKPHGINRARWCDVRISSHGAWWHIHRVTLESAYGRTPFFEFYRDRFDRFLTPAVIDGYPTISSLDLAIDAVIRSILLIDTQVVQSSVIISSTDGGSQPVSPTRFPPYHQVRALQQGFIPNLSILDLIFNLGPESPIYLRNLIRTHLYLPAL